MSGNQQQQNQPIYKVRIRFSKTGNAVFISHLDMLRTFTRAIRRAGIPAAYSQGFNPHLLLTFSMPLSLGTASLAEFADLRLEQEVAFSEIKERLSGVMPKNIQILAVSEAQPSLGEITSSRYSIVFPNLKNAEDLAKKGEQLFRQDTLVVEKKTKRTLREVDILPYLLEWQWETGDGPLKLNVRVLSGNEKTLNPNVLVRALEQYIPEFSNAACNITKTNVYLADGAELPEG